MAGQSLVLRHALALAREGIAAFPCDARKRPIAAGGFHAATTDAGALRGMFSRVGAELVGVPTGAASRLVVLDGDVTPAGDGRATLRDWTRSGRLPVTRTHETRRGGVHLLFRFDPAEPIGCTAGRLAPAVDTRGTGGYVCWWPAAGGRVLHDMPLAALPPLPAWIAAECQPPRARVGLPPLTRLSRGQPGTVEARLAALIRTAALAPEGSRNRVLYWAARRCGEMVSLGTLAPGAAEAVLIAAGRHAGLAEREAAATAQSGLRGGGGDGR